MREEVAHPKKRGVGSTGHMSCDQMEGTPLERPGRELGGARPPDTEWIVHGMEGQWGPLSTWQQLRMELQSQSAGLGARAGQGRQQVLLIILFLME